MVDYDVVSFFNDEEMLRHQDESVLVFNDEPCVLDDASVAAKDISKDDTREQRVLDRLRWLRPLAHYLSQWPKLQIIIRHYMGATKP